MNIYESINAVMADIGAIGKNSKNQTQGFMFRGIDAVMNALAPALIKHKVFVVPEILTQTREERTNAKGTTLIYSICQVKYTFYAEDGSNISAVVIGEGMDTGDKATNKAMSIAFKYACFQTFCIPTEEMVDPDAESHEVKPKSARKAEATPKSETITQDQEVNLVNLFCEKEIRINTIKNLYKVEKLNQLTPAQYDNIMKHLDDIKKMQEEKENE